MVKYCALGKGRGGIIHTLQLKSDTNFGAACCPASQKALASRLKALLLSTRHRQPGFFTLTNNDFIGSHAQRTNESVGLA